MIQLERISSKQPAALSTQSPPLLDPKPTPNDPKKRHALIQESMSSEEEYHIDDSDYPEDFGGGRLLSAGKTLRPSQAVITPSQLLTRESTPKLDPAALLVRKSSQMRKRQKKPVLWEQALVAAFFWGTSNFFYSMVSSHDFAVTCLSWTGFVLTSLVYRAIELWKIRQQERYRIDWEVVELICLSHLNKKKNIVQHIFRTVNGIVYIWLIIVAGNYCRLAQVNPGIVYVCFSLSIIFTSVMSFCLFHERLTLKMMLGIATVVLGVVWISLARTGEVLLIEGGGGILEPDYGEPGEVDNLPFAPDQIVTQQALTEDRLIGFRVAAVALSIIAGLVASLRAVQAKWVDKAYGYGPFEFSVDSGFITGGLMMLVWAYHAIIKGGHPGYTWQNILFSFIASTLMMCWSLLGLNSMVKGLQGPSSAIQQVQCIFSILLSALFLGRIPNFEQLCACLTLLAGVLFIIYLK
ncbi:hypothetical protein FGO68_gene1391 [Halteria grandinella]|uniref:EamA domain-containing protein n=1 Tax=Halteria grandinella TaxID=5974 RepID=A0A8J8T1J9_HALGN|nr:hypothetical protein FGO68_gene1391 [Halteria grandinella]